MDVDVILAPLPKYAFLDNNGRPLVSGLLFTYVAGTSTKIATYTDQAGLSQNTNPIVLDYRGEANVWLDPTLTYKFVLAPPGDTDPPTKPIWTVDNISPGISYFTLTQQFLGQIIWPRSAAEIAAGVIPVNYAWPWNWLPRYGTNSVPGTTDMLTAFQNAVAVSQAGSNDAIWVPEGKYLINGTLTIGQGVAIIGRGSQGSNENYGFTIVHQGTGDCLVWDGNGAAFAGTGGGIRNCLIIKKSGSTGGNAIKVIATDDNHRPGQMVFFNVLAYGEDVTALWSKGLLVDGTAANTPGARGVRTIQVSQCRFGDCTSNNQYVHLKQVTHFYGDLQMDTANGTGTLGMTIDDIWDHIDLDLRVGNVIVNYTGTDNPDLNLRGSCDTLDINSTRVIGVLPIKATTAVTNQSQLVRISSNLADAYTAFVSSTVGNVTGDGTTYTVLFDVEDFDYNLSYDTATGIYTVKTAGICDFNYGVVLTSLGAAHTTGELVLNHRDSGGSSKNQISTKYNVGAMRDGANQCSIANSIKLKVSEGDTVRVAITVSGSTKTVGVGGASTRYSIFSGKLLA